MEFYGRLLPSDIEMFRFAWKALKVPYHLVSPHPAAVGLKLSDAFCGNSVAQFAPSTTALIEDNPGKNWPDLLFIHINLGANNYKSKENVNLH